MGEGLRGLRLEGGDRLRVLLQDGRSQRNLALAFEGAFARRHLVEHGAKGEDVGANISLFAFDLLGRHVLDRPDDAPHGCERTEWSGTGHGGDCGERWWRAGPRPAACHSEWLSLTKVHELSACRGQHDVFRFKIAMK